jgi:hypothetical protein
VYWWKTTLDWSADDTARLSRAGVDRVGLRLFDWGVRGEEGPLTVRRAVPADVEVVPVAYVTTARLAAWAAEGHPEPGTAATDLLSAMDQALAPAWPGTPKTWQLDADWSASTRASWFAVVAAFRDLVHARGGRLEVTVRLHQYRDRQTQGVPPADGGVLMLYGTGDAVLDPDLVRSYLVGPPYPIALTPAWPAYTQVRQLNGYGRLVALYRIGERGDLPLADLEAEGGGRYRVLRRSTLGDGVLMARDELVVDGVDPAAAAGVAALPGVAGLRDRAGGRVWVFDYDRRSWGALVTGPLAPFLFPR